MRGWCNLLGYVRVCTIGRIRLEGYVHGELFTSTSTGRARGRVRFLGGGGLFACVCACTYVYVYDVCACADELGARYAWLILVGWGVYCMLL